MGHWGFGSSLLLLLVVWLGPNGVTLFTFICVCGLSEFHACYVCFKLLLPLPMWFKCFDLCVFAWMERFCCGLCVILVIIVCSVCSSPFVGSLGNLVFGCVMLVVCGLGLSSWCLV